MSCPIKPTGNRVVVKPIINDKVTSSGIIIPDTVSKEKPEKGEIVAVGSGKALENGQRLPIDLNVGQIVLFSKYSPTEFEHEKQKYLILDVDDIKAVIEA